MQALSSVQLSNDPAKASSFDPNLLPDLKTTSDLFKGIFSTSDVYPISTAHAFSASLAIKSIPAPLLPTPYFNSEGIRSPVSRSPGALDLGRLEAMADAQVNRESEEASLPTQASNATPMTCDSPVEAAPLLTPAPQSEPSADSVRDAVSVLPAPAIGDRFESREKFKQTCQQYADSFSAANPACRFHFATRTSSADKWLVFSCGHHTKGCPVLVRVERDRLTDEWVITAHQYEHKHPHSASIASHIKLKVPSGDSVSRPSSAASNKSSRKFSVIRKREKEDASLDYQPYPRPRSRNSITIPENKRRHSVDGNARSGSIIRAIIKHKRSSSDQLSINGSSGLLTEEALLPHFAAHGIQHANSNERKGSGDSLRPPSPSGSNSSISSGLYSYRSRGLSISSAGSDQASSSSSSLPEPTGTLQDYLTAVHQLLGAEEVVSALRASGIMDISTLLSLESTELHCLVDTFADVTTLQKLLIKNRIARALR